MQDGKKEKMDGVKQVADPLQSLGWFRRCRKIPLIRNEEYGEASRNLQWEPGNASINKTCK